MEFDFIPLDTLGFGKLFSAVIRQQVPNPNVPKQTDFCLKSIFRETLIYITVKLNISCRNK